MPALQIDVINSRQQGFLALFAGDTGEIRPEVGSRALALGESVLACRVAAVFLPSAGPTADPPPPALTCRGVVSR